MIPAAVAAAVAALEHQLTLVRLDFPLLTPRQQEQIAKSRCVEAITAANIEIDRRSPMPSLRQPGHGRQAAYRAK